MPKFVSICVLNTAGCSATKLPCCVMYSQVVHCSEMFILRTMNIMCVCMYICMYVVYRRPYCIIQTSFSEIRVLTGSMFQE